MKHKIGELVFYITEKENIYNAIINHIPMRITGITDDDRYIIANQIYAYEYETYGINSVINNLEYLISKSKKHLKFVRNLKTLEKRRNEKK